MRHFDRLFQPPSEDEFAHRVQKMLRRVGDRRRAVYDKGEFRLVFKEDDRDAGTMNLRNLYVEYCNTPKGKRTALLRRTCVGLASHFELPDDFEDVKPDLMPTIRPRSTLELMRLDVEIGGGTWNDSVPVLPVSDHLELCLVYDLPTRMQFVMRDRLDAWGVTIYEAAEIARQNLEEKEFAVGSLGDKLYVFVTGDAYDATRMLLIDRIRSLTLAGEPVAMPLNRDSLMVTGTDDEAGLALMADLAEKKKEEPRPICPVPHVLSGDDWEPWLPPAGHPQHEAFRLLKVRYLYGEYSQQKSLLEKLHERTGYDIFIASVSAIEREGKVSTWSLWPKGVLTWLPQTDYVGLADRDGDWTGFVPWDRLHAQAAHLMQPIDRYPPRWLVSDFPDPQQIEKMGPENWSKPASDV